MGRPATDKRERLVAAAVQQFHRRGYTRTSITDVATAAEVPVGNVFYYFKTKEDLARAVVDEWCRMLAGYLAALDALPSAMKRLAGFIDQAQAISAMYVDLGCPLAGLARDLRQTSDTLQVESGRVYALQFDWLKAQFEAAGYAGAQAQAYTRFLMAGHHGAILLAHAQNDPRLIDDEVAALKAWLRGLPRKPRQRT
jgi:AcrR family transcriptional regulator